MTRAGKLTLAEVMAAIVFDQPKLRDLAQNQGIVVRGTYLVLENDTIANPAGPIAEFDVKIVLPDR